MTTKNDRLNEELDKLRATRDELRLQIHLGSAEARDRFEKLEKSWQHVEGQVKTLHAATEKDRHRLLDLKAAVCGMATGLRAPCQMRIAR